MNFKAAVNSGYPFKRPTQIGYMHNINGMIVHHDNVENYLDAKFVIESANGKSIPISWLSWEDLLAEDWQMRFDFAMHVSKFTKLLEEQTP